MDPLQTLTSLATLLALSVSFVVAIFMVKANVGKSTNEAQASAITALQAEVITLRNRIADTEREKDRIEQVMQKESHRLEQILQTVFSALKMRGMIITVQGEMINIEDAKGTTTTRIQGQFHTEDTK